MTETSTIRTTGARPPACHFDRSLGERVTRHHRDTCPTQTAPDSTTAACPGRDGCAPCTAPHCRVCGREHATNAHPDTCPECIGLVREDLTDLDHDYALLSQEATTAAADGKLAAAAPIPGGTATILAGPSVRLDRMRISRETARDHGVTRNHRGELRSNDPVPPLAVLAQWEDLYRAWFDHTRGGTAKADAYAWHGGRPPEQATVPGAVRYLTNQLDTMANGPAVHHGPDWVAFTKSVRNLRALLERALHDEQEPERGVECFECGDRLVRRFRDPHRCTHTTTARTQLHRHLTRQRQAQDWLRTLRSYPEVPVREEDLAAARPPAASLVADARRPCAACQLRSQGGIDDPRAGRSWECPGCRKTYDVGEYATAVRRDLLDNGDQGDGWIHITAAAETVTDVVGYVVTEALIRKWVERQKVSGLCMWTPGKPWGLRLVYWPDVVTETRAAVDRMVAEAEKRRAREAQEAAWRRQVLAEVGAGRRLKPAARRVGKQLRLHPQRVESLLEALEQELAWRAAVAAGERPEVAARRLGIGEERLSELLDTVAA